MKKYQTLGMIGRFKPLHYGAANMLESLCESAEHVKIGIGSANKKNVRNPWSAEESKSMIEVFLSPKFENYEVLFIPDFGQDPRYRDGQIWRKHVVEKFGKLDAFATANDYVKELLQNDYQIINSCEFVSQEKRVPIKGSMVRLAMAMGRPDVWKQMVPDMVAKYLGKNYLVERFIKEFGLETIAGLADKDYFRTESKNEEQIHTFDT